MENALVLGLPKALHVLFAVAWVGGMFFMLVVLRPAILGLNPELEPPRRLAVFAAVLRRFFIVVWHAVVIVLVSGYWMMLRGFGGMGAAPGYVHLMHLLGLVMAVLFIFMYFRYYRGFKAEQAAGNAPAAAALLENIRRVVLINLLLGVATIVVASAGSYA